MKKIRLFILLLIIGITALLRFWNLSSIPVSLSHDEVAIGYNAWSILQTGRDEYGIKYPFLFRSFDDYKLPGYIYITALLEKFFGLNEFAVRLPSAFLGTLTVLVFYFLMRELFGNKSNMPIVASLMLAISPWHINFSRAAFEANGSLFFIVAGILFLFKGLKNGWCFIFASISIVLSIYFYYTARILFPIILFVFLILYIKKLIKVYKWILLSLLIGGILLFPIIPQMFTTGLSRINQVSVFEDKQLVGTYRDEIILHRNNLFSRVFYNSRMAYFHQISENFLKNVSADFYFINGSGPMGLLYVWELPFFFYGFYLTFKIKEKWRWIVIFWFLGVSLIGGLSQNPPNALRTLASVPVTTLFSSLGILGFVHLINKMKYFSVYMFIFITIAIFFFIRFFSLYFDYNVHRNATLWGDGRGQMVQFVKQHENRYDTIYITGDFWRPYIYFLFYSRYSPSEYQQHGSRYRIDNIFFGQANWDRGEGIELATADLSHLVKRKTLFIMNPFDFRSQQERAAREEHPYVMKIIDEINGIFVRPAFYAVVLK